MLVLLYIYINSINIPPIVIINRIYEYQNLLSLYLVSFLVDLRTYQQPFAGMRRIATFRSTTDRIYEGGPIIL